MNCFYFAKLQSLSQTNFPKDICIRNKKAFSLRKSFILFIKSIILPMKRYCDVNGYLTVQS